ncbi:hypothetical protein MMC07_000591 [Pseudocyphellaria aurata]|nr:hypothetical protein [Pseudocyphellaria aurata]
MFDLTLPFRPVSSACTDYWDGTAPFCRGGPCKPGYRQTKDSKTGDGKKCLTGRKVYCECLPPQPTNTCQDYWAGTAPFCKGECIEGYHQTYTSNSGNGGFCFTGHKAYCQCNGTPGSTPACVPKVPIKTTCLGFLLVCNNGCSTFGCGICFGSGNKRSIPRAVPVRGDFEPAEPKPNDNFYKSLVGENNDALRKALPSVGIIIPDDAPAETVAGYGMQYMESQLADLRGLEAAKSYENWGDTDGWVALAEPKA